MRRVSPGAASTVAGVYCTALLCNPTYTTFMYPVYHPIPSSSRLSVRPQALRAFSSNAVSQEQHLTPERRTPPPSVMKLSATRSGWRRRKHADLLWPVCLGKRKGGREVRYPAGELRSLSADSPFPVVRLRLIDGGSGSSPGEGITHPHLVRAHVKGQGTGATGIFVVRIGAHTPVENDPVHWSIDQTNIAHSTNRPDHLYHEFIVNVTFRRTERL